MTGNAPKVRIQLDPSARQKGAFLFQLEIMILGQLRATDIRLKSAHFRAAKWNPKV